MYKLTLFYIVVIAAGTAGFCAGWIAANNRNETQLNRVVAMSWAGGLEDAFYGAHVYLEPLAVGFSVRARVQIGRGNPMFHDCGELGKVETTSEAVARWGRIDWREDGLHIGRGTNHYFLSKGRLESHR